MSMAITHKNLSLVSIGILAFIGMTALGGCSQKPSSEDIAAQVKAAVAEAEKAKQEAATPAPAAPVAAPAEPAAAPVAPAPKHAAKAKHEAKAEPAQETHVQKAICANCGVVVSVKTVEVEGAGSGLGVIAGGVAGGLVGHQIGAGTGKDLATVAGVVGGAFAGNKIEKTMKKSNVYDVTVRMENGEARTLRQTTEPGVAAGDKVRIENDHLVKQ